MAHIGRFEYPELSLRESVEIAERIAREFSGSISRAGLARALGLSDRGGRYATVIGSLRGWGIAEGRSTVRLTACGLRAAAPLSAEESADALGELAAAVPLFRELAERLGETRPDTSRVALLLQEVTGASGLDVRRRVAAIARLLREVLPYLRRSGGASGARPTVGARAYDSPALPEALLQSDSPASGAGPVEAAGIAEPETRGPGQGRIEVRFPNGSISLPETPENIDAVMAVISARRKALAAGKRAG